jgi:PPIC-type PPIASE domain
MKRILSEPLLHFLLLGVAIFAAHGLLNKGFDEDREKIVVSQGQIAAMTEGFARTRQRAPSQEELDGLIRDRVQEEAYVREAQALGLDKDDLIIRRRLRQKMEFVSEGLAAPAEPSEAQLQAYLTANAAQFGTESRFSFRQVYLNPQRRGVNLERDAERLLAGLNQQGAESRIADSGDAIPLGPAFDKASSREVASLFGEKFAAALGELAPGRWQGPVESGYGMHLVFLSARDAGGQPRLELVRGTVRREWMQAQQREASGKFRQSLLRKYEVTIEAPSAASAMAVPVAAR